MDEPIPYLQELREELVEGARRRTAKRRRRRLVLAMTIGIVGLLMAVGVATGSLKWLPWPEPDDLPPGVEPRQLSEEITLAEGELEAQQVSWRFTAYNSDQGLCLHVEFAGAVRSKGGGCGGPADERGMGWHLSQNYVVAQTYVFGALPDGVATGVRMKLKGGSILEEPVIDGQGPLGEKFDFYLLQPPWGAELIRPGDPEWPAVWAIDAKGEVIMTPPVEDTGSLRRSPPSR